MRTLLVTTRLIATLTAAIAAAPSFGQAVPPALLVQTEPSRPSVPLTISRVDTRVVIRGTLAETTTTLTFHNALARVLEGELVFPLPEGSTVSGYALDLQGQLVDAVAVEKDEARVVFEQEVRKGVDPGLVEWTKGNNFRTRVYPIPAGGDRTVRVSYVSELSVARGEKGGLFARYHLPLRYRQPVAAFNVSIDYVARDGGAAKPEITGGRQLGAYRLSKDGNRLTFRFAGENVQPSEDLSVVLPSLERQSVALESDPQEGVTFLINDFPDMPQVTPQPVKPQRIAIYWDGSLSHGMVGPEVRKAELELLRRALKSLDGVGLDLVVFRNALDAPVSFTVEGGDCPGLFQALQQLPYDGGTALSFAMPKNRGALRGARGAGVPDYAYALLFTDGLGNLGDDLPRAELPVYTVSADATANHPLLRTLAQHSGGQYLNLQRLPVDQAVQRIGVPVFSLIRVEADPAQVEELYPRGVQAVNGSARVAGRLRAPEATLTLHYGFDAGAKPVYSVRYLISRSGAVPAASSSPGGVGLLARAWAQKKVDELALLPERNKEALIALGKRYNLVTPGTSMLVLETLEQHVQHHIMPAASRPELRREYLAQIEQQQSQEKQTRAAKLEQVVQIWRTRVEWWEQRFDYPRGFQYPERSKGDEGGGSLRGIERERASMAPRSAPAPAASVPMEEPMADAAPMAASAPTSRPSPERKMAPKKNKRGGDSDSGGEDMNAEIVIKPWDPATPYLATIKSALGQASPAEAPGRAYAAYLAQRSGYATSPAFYLDCAELFFRQALERGAQVGAWHGLAVRILSSIADLQIENPQLTRVVAHKLQQEGELDLAIDQFEKVLKLRPEEPQSYRDLALALADRARRRAGAKADGDAVSVAFGDAGRALNLLNEIVVKPWDGRFPEIEVIALEEANALAAWLERLAKAHPGGRAVSNPLDPRLRKLLEYDVRIVLTWDTDLTDMDLWVTEPSGEKCLYSHNRTTIGGAITHDFTQGYGPEEYAVRRAMPGKYMIQTNYYGSRQQTLSGPTTLQATVITHFGRPDESRRALTLRLTEAKEVIDVGTIEYSPSTTAVSQESP